MVWQDTKGYLEILSYITLAFSLRSAQQDLKLENIMLASVDPPEAVVIDVGLAELFPVSEVDSFRSADPAGTLATMAPASRLF